MATQIDPSRVAELLTYSPGWARVALYAGDERLREAAAQTLAEHIADHHDDPPYPSYDLAQMALPF